MNVCNTTRRSSSDMDEKEKNKIIKGFPRRNSTTVIKPNILTRRRSEVTLYEIQGAKKIEEAKKPVLRRQYSTFSTPKIISDRQNVGKAVTNIDGAHKSNELTLPRIPSVTPEPEEVKMAGKFRDSETFKDELRNGSYRPKHCWCFRCQLMYSMFKAGDDRLEMWGNYPCFKR